MAKRGCGTCRDRKVLCDRAAPTCKRCSRSKLKCQGYEMRLSWPRERDTRHAVLGKLLIESTRSRGFSDAYMVNTTAWDFEMLEYLSTLKSQNSRGYLTPPPLPTFISWNPFRMSTEQKDLLQYFESIASYSLTIFGQDPVDMRGVLLRMALSDNTPSTAAVMKSLLALSSLHRFGPQLEAAGLKISALQGLRASLRTGGIGAKEGIRHVAAGMLLCSFEVQQTTETSGQWLLYVCGAKDIIHAAQLFERYTRDAEYYAILDWAYYHDSLARFSIRHWRRHATIEAAYDNLLKVPNIQRPLRCPRMQLLCVGVPWAHKLLSLLSEICDSILDPSDPNYNTDNYRSFLKLIHWELSEIKIPNIGVLPQTDARIKMTSMTELYKLAGLVYLERATEDLIQYQPGVQWVQKAFALFSRLDTCEWPFPLLIFANEARTDEQRLILLDLIDRTEKSNSVRNLGPVLSMIRSIWTQDDLADEEMNYMGKLSIVVSSSLTVPTFV